MKWVALDLDGTLISCSQRQQAVLHAVSSAAGANVDVGEIWARKRAGLSTSEALDDAGVSAPLRDELARKWQALVEQPFWLQLDQCFDQTKPFLTKLRREGYRIALITGRAHPWWVAPQLRRLGLAAYLDEVSIVDPNEARRQKAEYLRRLRPIAFVGDTESDLAAAKLAGTPFLAVSSGQRDAEVLDRAGAEVVRHTLADLAF